jgi:lipopolysaccharide transport system permease protein
MKDTGNPAGTCGSLSSLRRHLPLILALTRREVAARFRGSFLGLFWALLLPLTMLAIYGFVFGVVMGARGTQAAASHGEYALYLFAGLLLHGLLAEVLNRSPHLLLHQVNFVKKIVFPVEILPLVLVLSALFQFLVGYGVLLLGILLMHGTLPPTVLLMPLILLPFCLVLAGASWLLSAIGAYFRDIGHLMGVATTVLLFLSTVFYPAERLPLAFRPLIYLNPLSLAADELRTVSITGANPNWQALLLYGAAALLIACAGFCVFGRLRKGFADVL